MVNQRIGYKVIVPDEALVRIKNDQCPSCGKPKSEWSRRKDWRCCSEECTRKYSQELVIFGWQDLRDKALKRDGWRCVKCGHQPLRKQHRIGGWLYSPEQDFRDHHEKQQFFRGFGSEEISGQMILYALLVDSSKLVGDHIVPIALGGPEFDIGNVQTLCETCNKEKTAIDAKRIAALRSVEKKLVCGQKTLALIGEEQAR